MLRYYIHLNPGTLEHDEFYTSSLPKQVKGLSGEYVHDANECGHDLVILNVPAEKETLIDEILDCDNDVIRYRIAVRE